MVCKNCGFDNNDQSKFCVSCGSVLEQPFEQPPQQPNYQQPYNQPYNQQYNQPYNAYTPYPHPLKTPGKGFAIAAMVLGIISFLCFPYITGILGIIFGGVAKAKGYRGGMATAGIVCGIIGVILQFLLTVVFREIYMELLGNLSYL